jgi:hypothetical protein
MFSEAWNRIHYVVLFGSGVFFIRGRFLGPRGKLPAGNVPPVAARGLFFHGAREGANLSCHLLRYQFVE